MRGSANLPPTYFSQIVVYFLFQTVCLLHANLPTFWMIRLDFFGFAGRDLFCVFGRVVGITHSVGRLA